MHLGIATDHGGFGLFSQAPRHLRRLSKVALLELQPTRTNP